VTRTDDSAVPDYQSRLRLDGRSFVVLGAGQGIGRQVSHALAAAGASTVLVDREAELAADIAEEVGGTPWSGDATDRSDVERLFAEAESAMGKVDGIVDIIGMARYGPLVDTDDESWAWHHDIVLRHAYLALTIGGKAIQRAGGGSAVFVASVSGMTAATLHAAYGAAKAGLIALVKSAAVELGPSGIRVNAVAPGAVWTPRIAAMLGEEGRARNAKLAPLRRVALPEDIAAALLFFASDLSSYVTGQTLIVDGGVSAKFPYPMPGES
jgi:NAD(P)-dependent dehydrogenase (short-subunit alcohol dehydrogenase family)